MTKTMSVSMSDEMYDYINEKKIIGTSAYIRALIAYDMVAPLSQQELMAGIGISSMLKKLTLEEIKKMGFERTKNDKNNP